MKGSIARELLILLSKLVALLLNCPCVSLLSKDIIGDCISGATMNSIALSLWMKGIDEDIQPSVEEG